MDVRSSEQVWIESLQGYFIPTRLLTQFPFTFIWFTAEAPTIVSIIAMLAKGHLIIIFSEETVKILAPAKASLDHIPHLGEEAVRVISLSSHFLWFYTKLL